MKYTAKQVSEAIQKAHGIKAQAARILGCSRPTIDNYIDKHNSVAEAYETANETILDMAESALYKNIQDGDNASIFFLLKTKGKHRGYIERQQNVNIQQQPDEIIIE